MKPLLLFACLFLSLGIKAQSNVYKPFPLVDGASWKVSWQGDGCVVQGNNQTIDDDVKYQYIIAGDTLIDTIQYKKLYVGPVIGFPYICAWPDLPYVSMQGYVGAIRQDTLEKKVFFYPEDTTQEYMLYDFTMQVGDTLKGYMRMQGQGIETYVVGYTDSVLVGNEYHKEIFFTTGEPIIEGIGSSSGLIEWPMYLVANAQLLCFSINGNDLYGPWYFCDMELTAIQENNHISPISIFPNPASEEFTVKVDNPAAKLTVTLFNQTGQQVGSYSSGENQILIPRNNLPDGVFIAKIQVGSSVVRRKMLLVD